MAEDEGEDEKIIGVSLASRTQPERKTCLGVALVNKRELRDLRTCNLRLLMYSQLSTLPPSFIFQTKQGWPLLISQEKSVKATEVISDNGSVIIERCFDKPRIGILAKTGLAIGFVFSEHSTPVHHLRLLINSQLKFFNDMNERYQFLDTNGWPVSREQEHNLVVMDILANSCVCVCADVCSYQTLQKYHQGSAHELETPPCKKSKVTRQLSFQSSKDSDRSSLESSLSRSNRTAKQILISYVHAESAQHAVTLKETLSICGFSVFLDVHEIKSGVDWQDSLNYAVSNCEVFVPLVTPRYGLTQWTNREVKLADVLGKFILPVSFIEEWPPRCLAIQFATTQYIYWRPGSFDSKDLPNSSNNNQEIDYQVWEKSHLQAVAKEIGQRLKGLYKKPSLCREYSINRRATKVWSCAAKLPYDPDGIQAVSDDRQGKPLIVITVHSKQTEFCCDLQSLLEVRGFEVWCTTQLSAAELDLLPTSEEINSLSQTSEVDKTALEDKRLFQEKADEAGLVIVVMSQAFVHSKTCQQQVFYCEHRKRIILLKFEDFAMPCWMSMLIGNSRVEDIKHENFSESLLFHIDKALDPTTRESPREEISEAKIKFAQCKIRKYLPLESCLYISGISQNLCKETEAVCKAIGQHLAALQHITLVTNGFFGVGELVSRTFFAETQHLWKSNQVWHILPEHDPQDQKWRACQNADGTFCKVSFGKTMFFGSSVLERETIVARVFDICILIEGGSETRHEAQQFAWNDRIVIPVLCKSGANGMRLDVPDKIFEVPSGVCLDDWRILNSDTGNSDLIGQAVAKIVRVLLQKLLSETSGRGGGTQMGPADKVEPKIKEDKKNSKNVSTRRKDRPNLTSMKTVVLG